MQISMYQASVPAFLQILDSLTVILDKAEAHCAARKIAPDVMASTRLIPDMFALARQVQITTDQAKGCVARLAGIDIPVYEDSESDLAQLKQRVAKTIEFVKKVTPAQIDGSEDKDIVLKVGGNEMTFKGMHYLVHFVLPNFYFHATTAYDILRAAGVELGKRDFLGKI